MAVFLIPSIIFPRSPLRKPDPLMPYITTNWVGDTKKHTLHSWYLEVFSLFHTFDKNYLEKHLFPKGTVTFRNDKSKSIQGSELSNMIEHLLTEVKAKKKKYRDFIVLKKRDFKRKNKTGVLVVKCKKCPFVVKLFMESPKSFTKPFNKGIEPYAFFIIGGGATRHFVGFTRIKNAEKIRLRISGNPHWSTRVDLPRKWFWTPKKNNLMNITGHKIGGHEKLSIQVPGTYAIIADAIEEERSFSLGHYNDRKTAIDLSNFLLCRIDPHINNFMIEKSTGLIIIIDTEHFPSLVGFKVRPRITSYSSWYLHLLFKFFKNRYTRSKKARIRLQTHPTPPFSLP